MILENEYMRSSLEAHLSRVSSWRIRGSMKAVERGRCRRMWYVPAIHLLGPGLRALGLSSLEANDGALTAFESQAFCRV